MIGVAGQLNIQEDRFSLAKFIDDNKWDLAGPCERFPSRSTDACISDNEIELSALKTQCSVILNANDYLFFDLGFRMLDAENAVELTAPEVTSVLVHGCSTVVRDQDPAGLNKLPDLFDFALAHGQRLGQDEHPIFVSRQLAFLNPTRTDKLVLQAKILN